MHDALADGLNPANVMFEITETAAVSNFENAERFARTLNDIGCNLALDDFGTGFGSFTYLKYVNARYLKIDLEFVRHLVSNDTDQKVVKSIVDIAHSLDKKTIAEGVEDAATLTALKDRGVDFAQGFYLGRPKRLSAPTDEEARNGPVPHEPPTLLWRAGGGGLRVGTPTSHGVTPGIAAAHSPSHDLEISRH